MKLINRALVRFGVQLIPATTAKMWTERACVMETTGYPSKVTAARHLFRCAEVSAR